jgi:hypothetical protein
MFRILCIGAALAASAAGEIKFRHHLADGKVEGRNWGQLALADIDRDGKTDIILGRSHWGDLNPGLQWYRNTGRIDRWQPPIPLGKDMISDCGIFPADVDRDGWIDIVSSAVWYRNPGVFDGKRLFDRYVYDKEVAAIPQAGAHDVIAAKLDASGPLSVISHHSAKAHKGLHLYQIAKQQTGEWSRVDLAHVDDQHGAISPNGIGDLNGDGRPDIVHIDRWFENGKGGWKEHRNLDFGRKGKWGPCARTWVADVDRDGRMDVIQSECDIPEARVAWFRNVRGDGSQWEKQILPESAPSGDYHSLAVADFDGDGDLDVYADEMEHLHVPPVRLDLPGMYVWENLDGKGGRWKKHTLATGFGGHEARVADMDGDGDPDIVTKSYRPGPNQTHVRVSILENLSQHPTR